MDVKKKTVCEKNICAKKIYVQKKNNVQCNKNVGKICG